MIKVLKITCVDKKLICKSRMVNVVDGCCKDGRHHLQRREHALETYQCHLLTIINNHLLTIINNHLLTLINIIIS